MEELAKLSAHHCVLLAAQYATESNISALRTLTALRQDDLEFGLILRLLLTFLPEILEPSKYTQYLDELAAGPRSCEQSTVLDVSSVCQISDSRARKKARRLHVSLQTLEHPLYESETELDLFTHFLIHRSHRIDAETGLLEFVPQLVSPFLNHSEYLRTWFVSTVLPLLRLGYEYYPHKIAPTLETFATWKGKPAIECLLSNLRRRHDTVIVPDTRDPARDLRGIVGPWLCGESQRERRRVDSGEHRASIDQSQLEETDGWQYLFEWLVHTSKEDFPLTSSALLGWDGPTDMDFGGYDEGQDYFDEDQRGHLERSYAQAAIASIYLVHDSGVETIRTAHSLLARLGTLLGFDPSPDLNVVADALPRYSTDSPISQESTTSILQDEQLLRPENPITQPEQNSARLLELFIFSAYLLSVLQYSVSVRDVARMYLRNDQAEQLLLLRKIIHSHESTTKRTAEQWEMIRSMLLWLWNWGSTVHDGDRHGHGIFGKIDNKTVETEILMALVEGSHFALAVRIYLQPPAGQQILSPEDFEKVVLGIAMNHFDNASNGNRTRGGVKRASDIIAAFRPHFPSSTRFQRTRALLDATHAMSFYSLTLQHGVPFQPVNIRVSADPLSLLQKLLSQNATSYTHLDDLISIGQNLVISGPATIMDESSDGDNLNLSTTEKKKAAAEKRVIGMAIEAALANDDFETAYSYVVNRLASPSTSPIVSPALQTAAQRFYFGSLETDNGDHIDDVSWRAALKAGHHPISPPSPSTPWLGSSKRPDLRGLEQRMELLSKALILAPPSHLEEVLHVWLQCEKEMNAFLAEEAEVEERFNDKADRRLPGAFANETVAVQPRREVGRGAVEEAPMGLFDVARGAAAAFTKTAFPLRATAAVSHPERRDTATSQNRVSMDLSSDSGSIGENEKVRKRDMLSSAVTGGLASGIGWVLGAPVPARERE